MSTFNIPSLTSDQAGSLAGSMNSSGYPFTMTQSGSGYNVDTNDEGSAYLGSAFPSGSSSSSDYGTLAGVFGNADTSNDGAGSGLSNNNGEASQSSGAVSGFFSKFGADGIAIVVGLIVTAVAVMKIV